MIPIQRFNVNDDFSPIRRPDQAEVFELETIFSAAPSEIETSSQPRWGEGRILSCPPGLLTAYRV